MLTKFDGILGRLRERDASSSSSGVSSVNGMTGAVTLPLVEPSSAMPQAAESNAGKVVLYTGASDLTYEQGHTYVCTYSGGVYSWTDITPAASGGSGITRWTAGSWSAVTKFTTYQAPSDGWLKVVRPDSSSPNAQVSIFFEDTDGSSFTRIVLPSADEAENISAEFIPVFAGMQYSWTGGEGIEHNADVFYSPCI